MWHRRWSLAVLLTLATVSCSRPADNAPIAEKSEAETPARSGAEPAPPEQPKPAEQARKKQVEPKPVPTGPQSSKSAPAPSSTPAPVPADAPVPTTQQSAGNSPAPAPIVVPTPQAEPLPEPVPPPPPPPTTKQVTIPAGTAVDIRMIDSINTDQSHPNETFRASLDKPIVVDGQTIIPRRSDVLVKVIEVQSAGKLSGNTELKVQLDRLFIGKQSYPAVSNTFTETGPSEGKKAVRNVGIGAAVGGIIGGILGGKKGAIIGAGTATQAHWTARREN